MAKNTRKKKSVQSGGKTEGHAVDRDRGQENNEKEQDEANPFDFGGLPARDLKKNLGCG